jgi:hypothetical protein
MLATTAEAASYLFPKGTDSPSEGYRSLKHNQKSGRSATELVQSIKEKIPFLGVKKVGPFGGWRCYQAALNLNAARTAPEEIQRAFQSHIRTQN